MRLRRPSRLAPLAAACATALGLASVSVAAEPGGGAATVARAEARNDAAAIVAIARNAMTEHDLKAVIVRVTVGGKELVTAALGESMTGVPATKDMHFRNGAVAISYMSMLLLRLVDEGKMSLDDKLSRWLPELRDADRVTLRMLANMTAGYADYVADDELIDALYANPFRQWTSEELIAIGLSKPQVFEPGTNWDYSHTNYVILGRALEKATGKSLARLLQEQVLKPLGLRNTASSPTPAIPGPVLHAYSSERRPFFHVDPSLPFYEESTFWSPSWTLAEGSIQTTNIYDMTRTARAIGEGSLLSRESHRAQVAPRQLGFGAPLDGCRTCHTLDEVYNYGLGVVLSGSWILQNPLFGGYGAVEAYLPSQEIAVAVATTFGEDAFDDQGSVKNYATDVFKAIGAYLAPGDAPPIG